MRCGRTRDILNRYVHNRAHPKGSMIERYCAEEVIKACQDYLREEDKHALGLPVTRHKGRLTGKGSKGRKTFIDKEYTQVEEAHSCVLQYLTMMEPFIEKHKCTYKSRKSMAIEAMDRSRAEASIWQMASRTRHTGSGNSNGTNLMEVGCWAIIPGHILAAI